MSAERYNGATGRALTEVGASGTVEIGGESHAASTAGAPIPAGSEVVVTGWRAAGESGYVLSVRERTAGESAPVPRPLRLPELPGEGPPAGIDWGWLLLTFGQIVSVLGCAGAALYAIFTLLILSEAPSGTPGASLQASLSVALGATAAILYSAAMFVVFTRVKRLPPADRM